MDRFGGWWRPWNYGEMLDEYRAVRSAVSLGDVSTLGKMLISGPDAVDALERLYPTTIADIRPGRSRYVLLLNERRTWPWLVAAAFAANLAFDLRHDTPWPVALLFCLTNAVQSTTGPSEVTFSTEHFSGAIDAGGARFYSFRVAVAGPVTANLASITAADSTLPTTSALRLGIGTPRGTGCALIASVTVSATLVSQLEHTPLPGVYCIEVADPGGLTGAVRFALRFTHP